MSEFQSARAERKYSQSLSLLIVTDVCNEEFQYQLNIAKCIDEQKRLLLNSDISIEDYLDAVEYYGVDIDKYVSEVERNLIVGLDALHG